MLSPKQEHSIRHSTRAVNIWDGSVRSGKTIASLIRWAIYVAQSERTGELIVTGRTRDSIARNIFAPLQDPSIFGSLAKHVHYTPGAPQATMYGKKVWVLGTADSRAENILRGLTCAGAYIDEITLLPENFFVQLLNRMWEDAQLFGTTNPDNPAHWLKRVYLDRIGTDLPDWVHFRFNLDDNPALTEERKERIRRENTGLYYRRFVLGEWVAAEGAILETWDPQEHTVTWDRLPNFERVLATGIDYGTQNATSAIMLGVTYPSPTRKLVLLDEWTYDARKTNRRLTDAQQSKALLQWYRNTKHIPDSSKRALSSLGAGFVIDPSAASFKVQLSQDMAPAITDADNDISYGVRLLSSLVSTNSLLVTDRCQGFISEAPGYSWDPKQAAKGKDLPIPIADHSMDAARYAITTTESIWRGLNVDLNPDVVP